VNIYGNRNTSTCGGSDRIDQTDAKGTARIDVDATFRALELMMGGPHTAGDPSAGGKSRDLTDAELREFFAKRKLTTLW
jgi:hypothetical protein